MLPEINNRVLVFLLSSIGLITLPHVENVPLPVFAFFAGLLGWRFIGVWKKNWLPHKIIIFLITLGSIILMFSQYRSVLGRDAGTSLFVLALGLKLLEIKSQRDLYLITYLAFIVASSLFLYEQSILMAVYILFVCCVLLATLVTINSEKPQTWVALKKSAIIILQALPIAAVLFVLFPRVEAPRWMLFKNEDKAKLGLSDTLEPGSISDLGLSPELVFRVKFKGDIPPPNQRYWRGPTYSYTDGKRWTHSSDFNINPFLDTPRFSGKAYQYTLLMESQNQNWIFALDMPAKFSVNTQQNGTYQLISLEPPNTRAEYQITSYPAYNTGKISASEYGENLQLPASSVSSEINTLVTKLHGFDQPPEVFIQALLQHFRNEKFYYTLKPPLMEENPIETFLFKTRYGFCSHYATAFVYLMRVAHIPARVIGGYQGGEMNKVGQFLEVRQADAHAWAEVWLENKGWVRFDPTAAVAPERVEQGVNVEQQVANQEVDFSPLTSSNASWLKQARQMWQTIDYSWQRWVINYDRANQSEFLSSLGIHNLQAMLYTLLYIISFITAVLAWFLLRKNRRHTDKVVLVYDRFCRKLAKAQIQRQSNEGARDFAVRASASLPEYSAQINAITNLYLRLRYGKNPTPQLFEQLNQSVASFKVLNHRISKNRYAPKSAKIVIALFILDSVFFINVGNVIPNNGRKLASFSTTKKQIFEPEMVAIKGGCFQMGSPETEAQRRAIEKQHEVCVKNFEMGKYEVTKKQFANFIAATNYTTEAENLSGCAVLIYPDWKEDKKYHWRNPAFSQADNHPVTCVSWNDVQTYIDWLNSQTGKTYQLPTEAQWEYAVRADTTTAFYTGDCISTKQANYDGSSDYNDCKTASPTSKRQTTNVGFYAPNKWGLYDMAGNVTEWTCSDYIIDYDGSEKVCSSNNAAKPLRVARGGAWSLPSRNLRSAKRYGYSPSNRDSNLGFRLSRM